MPAPLPPTQLPHPIPPPPSSPRPGEPGHAGRPAPPDPEAARDASRRTLTISLLLVAALVTNALPLPFQAASLAFVLTALVVGIRALLAARRAGLRGPLVSALAIGLAFTSLLLVSIVALLALWPMQLERQQCLQQAQTLAATSGCQADFQRTLEDRLREMRGTGTGT